MNQIRRLDRKCSITPKAIQDLLDELEASRQAWRRAWDVLQDPRAVLANLGNVTIEVPSRKTFEAEGAILKQALSDCLRDQRAVLAHNSRMPRGRSIKLLLDRRQNSDRRTRRCLRPSTARRFCYKVERCAAGIAERPEKKS